MSALVSLFSSLPVRGKGGSLLAEVKGTLRDWTRSAIQPCPTVRGLHGEVMSQQSVCLWLDTSLPSRPLSQHFKPRLSVECYLGGWHQDQAPLHTWKVLQGWKKGCYLTSLTSANLRAQACWSPHLPTQSSSLNKSLSWGSARCELSSRLFNSPRWGPCIV